jgi:glycosyltransferase involved in cell wall biosynthesis
MAKIAVCLIAKDEERYLLEWMAYNLVLGFDEILVYDNDSVDGSRRLVEQAGEADRRIRYVPWPGVPGRSPQVTAYNHALGNTDADWIAFIDADEFIVLSEHGTIGEFLAGFDEAAGAVCLHWRLFGSSGHTAYADDLVIRRFTRCDRRYNHHVKSIVRRSCMAQMHIHVGRLSSGTYVDANGAPVTPQFKIEPIPSRHPASINHYVLKSAEEYQGKMARGQACRASDSPDRRAKFTPEFWAAHDRNDVEDATIFRVIPALEIEMARLLPTPGPAADDRLNAWHCVKTLFKTALRSGPTRRRA